MNVSIVEHWLSQREEGIPSRSIAIDTDELIEYISSEQIFRGYEEEALELLAYRLPFLSELQRKKIGAALLDWLHSPVVSTKKCAARFVRLFSETPEIRAARKEFLRNLILKFLTDLNKYGSFEEIRSVLEEVFPPPLQS